MNSIAYSLASYPAGNGNTATGDAIFTTDIPDNDGVALFNTSNPANFTLGNRFDAVGSSSVSDTLYREGAGFAPLVPFSVDYNNADFIFVDTNGTSAGAGQRLGTPGPENLTSPRTLGTNDQTKTMTTPVTVHLPDAKDIAAGTLRLRAERVDSGDGRVYLIVVKATDTSGNVSQVCHTVVVPRKKKGDLDAQAGAAKAFCEANNFAPPPGYFLIGDGPIIGPKQ